MKRKFINILKILLFVYLSLIIAAIYMYPLPDASTNGFIKFLGNTARLFYLHIPMAWLSVIAFLSSFVFSIIYINKKDIKYDHLALATVIPGMLFSFLASVSGAIWAKMTWLVYWSWDPRQIGVIVISLIYISYLILRNMISDFNSRAKISSIYNILAFPVVPMMTFIIPNMVEGIYHTGGMNDPGPLINSNARLLTEDSMFIIFIASLIGFSCLYVWIVSIGYKVFKIKHQLFLKKVMSED